MPFEEIKIANRIEKLRIENQETEQIENMETDRNLLGQKNTDRNLEQNSEGSQSLERVPSINSEEQRELQIIKKRKRVLKRHLTPFVVGDSPSIVNESE